MPRTKKVPESAGLIADPRSEVLKLLDSIETPSVASIIALRNIRRLIERTWGQTPLPKRKVRIWWGPTDLVIHAESPGDAIDIALASAPVPIPMRLMVFTENKDGAWDPESDRTLL